MDSQDSQVETSGDDVDQPNSNQHVESFQLILEGLGGISERLKKLEEQKDNCRDFQSMLADKILNLSANNATTMREAIEQDLNNAKKDIGELRGTLKEKNQRISKLEVELKGAREAPSVCSQCVRHAEDLSKAMADVAFHKERLVSANAEIVRLGTLVNSQSQRIHVDSVRVQRLCEENQELAQQVARSQQSVEQVTTVNPSVPVYNCFECLSEEAPTRAEAVLECDGETPDKGGRNLDLLIVGNSHVSNLNDERLFRQRMCKVVSLQKKSIEGAMDYVRATTLRPKVLVLHVVDNDLCRLGLEGCIRALEDLVKLCRAHFGESTKIFISEVLRRNFKPTSTSEEHNRLAYLMNSHITNMSGVSLVGHPNLRRVDFECYIGDGVHMNSRGLSRYVVNMKSAVHRDLGYDDYKPNFRHGPKQQQRDRTSGLLGGSRGGHLPLRAPPGNMKGLLSNIFEGLLAGINASRD